MSKSEQSPNMSSRLLNMKFMQRGSGSPSTPASLQPLTKRRRVVTPSSISQDADQTAKTRTHESEDSEWYLSMELSRAPKACAPVTFVSAGLGALDAPVRESSMRTSHAESGDDDTHGSQKASLEGRRTFGAFKRRYDENIAAQVKSGTNVTEFDERDPGGIVEESINSSRTTSRANPTKRMAESKQNRRKKEVDLNKITSISGYGNRSGLGRPKT